MLIRVIDIFGVAQLIIHSGIIKINLLPTPSFDSTLSEPFKYFAASWAINNPRPDPGFLSDAL